MRPSSLSLGRFTLLVALTSACGGTAQVPVDEGATASGSSGEFDSSTSTTGTSSDGSSTDEQREP